MHLHHPSIHHHLHPGNRTRPCMRFRIHLDRHQVRLQGQGCLRNCLRPYRSIVFHLREKHRPDSDIRRHQYRGPPTNGIHPHRFVREQK